MMFSDVSPTLSNLISPAENQPSGHRRVGVRKAGCDRGALLGQRGTGVDRQQLEVSEPKKTTEDYPAW